MQHALKLIIARSPNAATEAMRALQAIRAGSPMVQQRYNRTVEMALADPRAVFTAEERALLAEHLEVQPDGTRGFTLRVKLTPSEHQELEDAARAAHLGMSEYVRRRLFQP